MAAINEGHVLAHLTSHQQRGHDLREITIDLCFAKGIPFTDMPGYEPIVQKALLNLMDTNQVEHDEDGYWLAEAYPKDEVLIYPSNDPFTQGQAPVGFVKGESDPFEGDNDE